MQLPAVISVQTLCNEDEELSGLTILMTGWAGGRGGTFGILFPKTDRMGLASITAEDFRRQFAEHCAYEGMHRDFALESACRYIRLELFNPAAALQNDTRRDSTFRRLLTLAGWKSIIRGYSLFGLFRRRAMNWRARAKGAEQFRSSRNALFESDFPSYLAELRSHFVELPSDGKLTLSVRRRRSDQPLNRFAD